jgi:hypothetical protein
MQEKVKPILQIAVPRRMQKDPGRERKGTKKAI